jgi:hypothetical protein
VKAARWADQQLALTAQTRLIDGGASPINCTFGAKLRSEDLLLGGNLVPWVHPSTFRAKSGEVSLLLAR